METLFQNYKIPEKKKGSERADVISFFVENLRNKDGKKFPARMIAIKLSHIPTKDLYYIKSVFQDTSNRKGIESANKEFWWSLKSNPIIN